MGTGRRSFPVGAAVTVTQLDSDPHPVLRQLRAAEPVSWLPAIGGWLVTRADLAERVLRDPAGFTVDDPRFTTSRVVGPSMLSLDGAEHQRHRSPFVRALRRPRVRSSLSATAVSEAARLVAALASGGSRAELRRDLAGPLAVSVMAQVLGLEVATAELLGWYDAIVAGVSALSAEGSPATVSDAATAAFDQLRHRVHETIQAGPRGGHDSCVLADASGTLQPEQVVSNAAVLLFGGIETTEGLISNAIWYLLSSPDALRLVRADHSLLDAVVEEALRLEPAAAVVDRYATADCALGQAPIRRGDLVTVSLAGANRDPAVFPDPDRFDLRRTNGRQHLAFAVGPHFCPGAQLSRDEASAALGALLDQLPGLRLEPSRPSAPRGLVFRKPPTLHVCWD